jgi:hypothetical protein
MRRGNPLIYSAVDNFCTWQLVLPHSQSYRETQGRKLIRRVRCT